MNLGNNNTLRSYSIYILVIILAILQIIISNRLTNVGKRIGKLTNQTNEITVENERLKKEIASSSAIFNLTQKARELGFNNKAQILYLDELYSVAQNSL